MELLSKVVFGMVVKRRPDCLVSLDAILEPDSGNDLGQAVKAPLPSLVLLCTFRQFEHHMQHSVTGQAAFGSFRPMTDRAEGGFNRIRGSQASGS